MVLTKSNAELMHRRTAEKRIDATNIYKCIYSDRTHTFYLRQLILVVIKAKYSTDETKRKRRSQCLRAETKRPSADQKPKWRNQAPNRRNYVRERETRRARRI